ncbi:alpha/beta fold hydrolase [Modicisalibacter luteus]|uniref:alpha/beta fold hydrolase n=1 Tax=Modicisalibacter luteus TaxID=453962 RepID=UPI003635B821
MTIQHNVQRYALGSIRLQNESILEDAFLTYSTHGRLNRERSNAILLLPPLMANHTRYDFLIGPGKAFDTDRYYVITADTLGNGYAISPSNSPSQAGDRFPRFTILDMVDAQYQLIRQELKIARLLAVGGLSMGGMQALQWGVKYPDMMETVIALATMAHPTPWVKAIWHTLRKAMQVGQHTNDEGVSAEAMCAATTFFLILTRHWEWFDRQATQEDQKISHWLDTQSSAMAKHWDMYNFIYQTLAEDSYELGDTKSGMDYRQALSTIRASVLFMPSASDLLHPANELHEAMKHVPQARIAEIPSACGHMGGGGLTLTI